MFIQTVCNALERHRVTHAIVGGYAVALHGAVRGTFDVDIALAWDLQNLQAAETALRSIGLESRLPITAADVFHFRDEYISKRNLIAWHFVNPRHPIDQVDIIINFDLATHATCTISKGKLKLTVLALDDLIAMKKSSGREQDMADVTSLEKLRK